MQTTFLLENLKGRLGRLRRRYEDNIGMDLKEIFRKVVKRI
jgi:hypothetical protein